MNRLFLKPVAAAVLAIASSLASAADCYSCSPQCVPAARKWSNVNVPRVEFARDVIPAAKKLPKRFKVSAEPRPNSYGVVDIGAAGHAIAVTKMKNGTFIVQHANMDCKCSAESVYASWKGGKITFLGGHFKNKTYKTLGFVTNK